MDQSQSPNKTEMLGYVSYVSPQKMSSRNNPYFDIELKTTPTLTNRVRVMINKTTPRNLFSEKCESKSQIKLTSLSPSKTSPLIFYNTNTGSRMSDTDKLMFPYVDGSFVNIADIHTEQQDGLFNVIGKLTWINDARTVHVGESQTARKVRDGILTDETGQINASFWGEELLNEIEQNQNKVCKFLRLALQSNFGLKLTSTSNSMVQGTDIQLNIKLHNLNIPSNTIQLICCPQIMSAKNTRFLQCVNIDCRKKVVPFHGETTVFCNNSTCRRKMLVERCRQSYSLEITVDENITGKQHVLTVFPKVVETFFSNSDINIDTLEDRVLSLKNTDFTVNRRKIVVKMEPHQVTLDTVPTEQNNSHQDPSTSNTRIADTVPTHENGSQQQDLPATHVTSTGPSTEIAKHSPTCDNTPAKVAKYHQFKDIHDQKEDNKITPKSTSTLTAPREHSPADSHETL